MELRRCANDFNMMAERLQRYERELKDSSAAIAHELRTPLTAAGARVQGMIDGVFPCDASQLKQVMLQLDSLGRLVADLHAYSLALSGQFDLTIEAIRLRDLVQERCDWAQPQLDAEGMVVHNRLDAELDLSNPRAADAARNEHVLSKLRALCCKSDNISAGFG
ncbi:histidine kinase dimerization/phospho-acceptor domain-containing protein [Methylibium rhizosphaerae]|uniref:histidine kinase dimerization/phospho-acceptor domain-containing protein n=1 Tax=Methylibium rhizosphaerae TaxID=2570323 RepID=UPI001128055B|nr:histidine kinase dimerization/phospho-acceptor domain-containing protein [Methylibium rhizosphaerae]